MNDKDREQQLRQALLLHSEILQSLKQMQSMHSLEGISGAVRGLIKKLETQNKVTNLDDTVPETGPEYLRERPAAQERWVVCYDLEFWAMSLCGYLELCSELEGSEKLTELINRAMVTAERVLTLATMLRHSGILEAEKPPEGKSWPVVSPSLRARFKYER